MKKALNALRDGKPARGILVGEVRDADTAQIAVQASLTVVLVVLGVPAGQFCAAV